MSKMDDFIGLSAVLTGFAESKLAPQIDPIDIKSEYLPLWQEKVDEQSNGLSSKILATYSDLKSVQPPLSDQKIGEAMLSERNGADFTMACRQLIYLWYMGAWPSVPKDNSRTDFTIVSSKAYSTGLVWQVMQAHPMGDSNERYGYWAEKPSATLSDFTGHSSEQ
ncbi:hypothetical protein CWC31_12770 [Pseudoalteromonas ruthenica]|uniref:hypothetical protein n=1 Tax=Pseudoalteromonas ruthenica TaxID=151081 RepID=UPI0011094A17|nr:hypothetical protein [Pseudoalteromonas ruthenica]TLX50163.1 hypothetical protein CWC31_12770 [Pseudoalteromonas ruthenica]